jgi:RNA polymerase sigma factor for flagellar operon FliA
MSQAKTKYTQIHSSSDRQEMIMKHYPMVRQIAGKMAKSYPQHVEIEDLIQVGVLGLIEAIDRYQAGQFSAFAAYARIRIQGAILDNRRSQDWTPRSVRDRANLINNAQTQLKEQLKRNPSEIEMARYLNVSPKRLQIMRSKSEIRQVLSLEHGAEESLRIGDIIPSNEMTPQENLMQNEVRQNVKGHIDSLNERELKLVTMHYYDGTSFNQISKEFKVSEARISQIHSRIKSNLRKRLSQPVGAS